MPGADPRAHNEHPTGTSVNLAWRRFCDSADGVALDRLLHGVEQRTDRVGVEFREPPGVARRSPMFGLLRGETRRIVIDGVPFDISRDIADVGDEPN